MRLPQMEPSCSRSGMSLGLGPRTERESIPAGHPDNRWGALNWTFVGRAKDLTLRRLRDRRVPSQHDPSGFSRLVWLRNVQRALIERVASTSCVDAGHRGATRDADSSHDASYRDYASPAGCRGGACPWHDAPLSCDTVAEIQRALARLGFDPGPIDGIAGSRTRAAVKAYQTARGLEPSRLISADLAVRVLREDARAVR